MRFAGGPTAIRSVPPASSPSPSCRVAPVGCHGVRSSAPTMLPTCGRGRRWSGCRPESHAAPTACSTSSCWPRGVDHRLPRLPAAPARHGVGGGRRGPGARGVRVVRRQANLTASDRRIRRARSEDGRAAASGPPPPSSSLRVSGRRLSMRSRTRGGRRSRSSGCWPRERLSPSHLPAAGRAHLPGREPLQAGLGATAALLWAALAPSPAHRSVRRGRHVLRPSGCAGSPSTASSRYATRSSPTRCTRRSSIRPSRPTRRRSAPSRASPAWRCRPRLLRRAARNQRARRAGPLAPLPSMADADGRHRFLGGDGLPALRRPDTPCARKHHSRTGTGR